MENKKTPNEQKTSVFRNENKKVDEQKSSVFRNKNKKEIEEKEKKTNTKKWVIGAIALAVVAITTFAVYFFSMDRVGSGGSVIGQEQTKPIEMDNGQAIDQYSVKVYENIIIGNAPFVFENIKGNDADLCYSIMYKEEELFNTGWMAPGEATSWRADNVEKQGKTYGCNIIVSARDRETGEELNSMNIRQLIYVDNKLPQTTGGSAYKYTVTIDAYSKAKEADGKQTMGYGIAVAANRLHPAEEGATIKLYLPETITIKGNSFETEVAVNPFKYATQEGQFIYMVGQSEFDGPTGDDYKMITTYYVNTYDEKDVNGVFTDNN